MWAAYKGYPACIDVLLRWGADVNARDETGFTALHWALVKGSYPCAQKLVEYGADRFAANNDGKTPAVTAKEMNSLKQWRRALADSGFDANGHAREFPMPMVKDTRKFLARIFFVWPFFILVSSLYIASMFPVYIGIPTSMVLAYTMQTLAAMLLRWAPSDMKHIHKTVGLVKIGQGTFLNSHVCSHFLRVSSQALWLSSAFSGQPRFFPVQYSSM